MTMRYAHLAPSHVQQAVEKLVAPSATTTAPEQKTLKKNTKSLFSESRTATGVWGWWALQDLNLGPMDYESTALTAELRAPAAW